MAVLYHDCPTGLVIKAYFEGFKLKSQRMKQETETGNGINGWVGKESGA